MNENTKQSNGQKLSDFIIKQKKALLFILVLVVAITIVIAVVSISSTTKANEVSNSTNRLIELYEELTLTEDKSSDEFEKYAESLIKDYKGTKAELLAYSRLASYNFDQGNFQKAVDNYTLAYSNFPDDIATSVNMFNAAMSYDELGNVDEAINVLTLLVEKFKSSTAEGEDLSADVPEAIFNLARLYESKNDTENAVKNYEILVAEYNSYNLSSLAKSRLIDIK